MGNDSVFASTSLINSKCYKIGNGIGNFLVNNSQELRTGNFGQFWEGGGKDTDRPIGNGSFC